MGQIAVMRHGLSSGRARAMRWMARNLSAPGLRPVIVYQMAKVGSSSVVAALERARYPVFHVHRMNPRHLQHLVEQRRRLEWEERPLAAPDALGLGLNRDIVARGRRARVITMVRDPIARNFSSYFEHLDQIWATRNAHDVVSIDDLVSGFYERFPHDEPLTWFDDEMKPVLGLDIYAHPFPVEIGSLTIRAGPFEVLVLRCEMPDEEKGAALGAFLGMRPLICGRQNVTLEKPYGRVFEAFRVRVRLTPDFVDRMLSSRYATHFYSPQELERLRRRHLTGDRAT